MTHRCVIGLSKTGVGYYLGHHGKYVLSIHQIAVSYSIRTPTTLVEYTVIPIDTTMCDGGVGEKPIVGDGKGLKKYTECHGININLDVVLCWGGAIREVYLAALTLLLS